MKSMEPVQETPKQLVEFAIERLLTALKYGPDMATSREVCIKDAIALLNNVLIVDAMCSALDLIRNELGHGEVTQQLEQALNQLKNQRQRA